MASCANKFTVFTSVLFLAVLTGHCSVLDRPVDLSHVPDMIAEASEPTATTVSLVLSPPPLLQSATTAISSVKTPAIIANKTVVAALNATAPAIIVTTASSPIKNNQTKIEPFVNTTAIVPTANSGNATAAPLTDLQQQQQRHDSKVMEIIQMGLTSLRHAGDRLKKFVTKIEAGIKSGALNETIENVKVKIEKGEIDLKKIIHAYKQKSAVGLEQLIKRISDDSHTLLDKLHGRVDAAGTHVKEIPHDASDESAEEHHPKSVPEASETVAIFAPVPTETVTETA